MGVRHVSLPLEGVQFHPESVLTPEGPHLLANFLRLAGEGEAGRLDAVSGSFATRGMDGEDDDAHHRVVGAESDATHDTEVTEHGTELDDERPAGDPPGSVAGAPAASGVTGATR
jgi:hypothetical protein